MSTKLLIINPNSSVCMTDGMKANIDSIFFKGEDHDNIDITYFTGPKEAPPQIDGVTSSIQSMNACLPILREITSQFYYDKFDGILVGCFSDHPLVHELTKLIVKSKSDTIVYGLLDSSIYYCNMLNGQTFSIITSNKEWVPILNNSVEQNFLTEIVKREKLWRGTVSTDLQVLDLHSSENFQQITDIIRRENIERLNSKVVILGCAGFSGLQHRLSEEFDGKVTFVDSVTMGLNILITMISLKKQFR